jgi:HD-GYP domain-containing protein (c-di-GMP phosphodiesterase class II)
MTKDHDGKLRVRASRTANGDELSDDHLVSTTIVNRAFRDRVGILTLDAGVDERFDARASIVDQNIRSAICVPMVHQDVALGVIYLDTVGVTHAFKEDDLRLLTGIAGPAGGAVKNALLVAQLRNTAVDTILRLAMAAEYRDDDTGFHIHRMSDYAETIARALGLEPSFCDTLKLSAPMHDVGKIGIRDAILKKPGRLTPEEFEEMKQHTIKGGAILSKSDSDLLKMAENIALTHHEKFDGSGYPRGLGGDDIPIEGRVVAVADVFDALTTKRCYKPAFSVENAFGEIADGRGKHFDPRVAECFLSIRDRIVEIRDHYLNLEAESQTGDVPNASTFLKSTTSSFGIPTR